MTRFFENWFVWDKSDQNLDNDVYLIVYGSSNEEKSYASDFSPTGFVKGSARGYYKARSLTSNVCELTMVQHGSLAGNIPIWIMHLQASKSLLIVEQVQEKYRRSGKIVDKVRVLLQLIVLFVPT